jgi:hypothetical protein
MFNRARYIMKAPLPCRWIPNDLPPWATVYQQTQRWLAAVEVIMDDLRAVLRLASRHSAEPTTASRRKSSI